MSSKSRKASSANHGQQNSEEFALDVKLVANVSEEQSNHIEGVLVRGSLIAFENEMGEKITTIRCIASNEQIASS
ncbi:hypothetical protein Tco_1576114 [Tanacetum coccineum]